MEDGLVLRSGPPTLAMPVAAAAAPVPKALGVVSRMARRREGAPDAEATQVDVAEEVETLTFVTVPSREDFPELAYLELFPVDGVVERTVPLGDQIGTWRCRAYLVSGLDVLELTADVEAAKTIYAELDLPAIVGQGDDILAGVHYHTQQPATMTITLPDGQEVSGAVMGHGAETFHLVEPGDVTVHIFSQEGEDWTTRTVQPPGVQPGPIPACPGPVQPAAAESPSPSGKFCGPVPGFPGNVDERRRSAAEGPAWPASPPEQPDTRR